MLSRGSVHFVAAECKSRGGVTREQQAIGKASAREFRAKYPELPKFAFLDDEADVALAVAAALAAAAVVTASSSSQEPCGSETPIVIQASRKRRHSERRQSHSSDCLRAAVAEAVAAATAAATATTTIGPSNHKDCSMHKRGHGRLKMLTSWLKGHEQSAITPLALQRKLQIQRYDSLQDARDRCLRVAGG